MYFQRAILSVLLIIILSVSTVVPFINPGFFPMHDDTQVARVFEMGKALKDGMFPVRWVSDFGYGYGYPIFNFYAPLAYYFGGFFNSLGFEALVSTKIMMIFGIILSGLSMYLLAREFWGELGGVVSGLFYVFAPYHAVQIYVRGDVSEFWAYAFIPLVFYGLYKAYKKGQWRFVVIGSLGFAGIILSHNLTAMMITPFLLVTLFFYGYFAFRNKKLSSIYRLISIILIGLLISAFYWIPAIIEMSYTNIMSQIGGGADFRDHFVCLNQFWESQWGFGGSAPGCIDGLSFRLGKIYILLSLISVIVLFLIWKKEKEKSKVIIFSIISFFVSILLMLEISKPLWEIIRPMEFFQYPWRFLIMTSFFMSFVAGVAIWYLEKYVPIKRFYFFASAIVVFLLMFQNLKLFVPQSIETKPSSDYTNEAILRWNMSKISDEYLPKGFKKPNDSNKIPLVPTEITDKNSKTNILLIKTGYLKAEIILNKAMSVKLNIAYFPSWKTYLNGAKTAYKIVNNGLSLEIPKGSNIVEAKFEPTTVQLISNLLSIIGIFTLFIGIISSKKGLFRD